MDAFYSHSPSPSVVSTILILGEEKQAMRLGLTMKVALVNLSLWFGGWKSKNMDNHAPLPEGSWVKSSKQAQELSVGKDADAKCVYQLRAKLKNNSRKWKDAKVTFRVGDDFANDDGAFMPQNEYDDKAKSTQHANLNDVGALEAIDFLIVHIPVINCLWISCLRNDLNRLKSDRKLHQKEREKLQKKGLLAFKENSKLHEKLSILEREKGDWLLQQQELIRVRKKVAKLEKDLKKAKKNSIQGREKGRPRFTAPSSS